MTELEHSDASRTARDHLMRLGDAVRSAGVHAAITKEQLTGPWILRCELPGIKLAEKVICGAVADYWFFAWHRGDYTAAVGDVGEVAGRIAQLVHEAEATV